MTTQKNIALVIDSLAGGGAEKVVIKLAHKFQQQGHNVHLLVLYKDREYLDTIHVPIQYFSQSAKSPVLSARTIFAFKHWISSLQDELGQFDVFFSNLDKSNFLMAKAQVKSLYCVIHNAIKGELSRQMKLGPVAYLSMRRLKKAINGQHPVVTVSQGLYNEVNELKIKYKSLNVVYNPFDIDDMRQQSLEVNDSIPQKKYILHIGRMAKQKRHDVLFQALKASKNDLDLVLLCSNKNKALELARKYGVEDRVICPGFQSNPYNWIKHAELLVLSSDYEGLPLVLLESLLCLTPAVSTDCPHGPNEILTGEFASYLAKMNDPIDLALKIDMALNHYPSLNNDIEITNKIKINTVAQAYLDLIP